MKNKIFYLFLLYIPNGFIFVRPNLTKIIIIKSCIHIHSYFKLYLSKNNTKFNDENFEFNLWPQKFQKVETDHSSSK